MENNTMTQRTKRLVVTGTVFIGAALAAGCTGYGVRVVAYAPPPPPPPAVVVIAPAPAPEVVVSDGPVVVDPTVVLIDVEPAPAYRVYVYDPGFPPGAYFYGGFYYYGRYRYPHDVFIHSYVEVNVRQHRFMDARENRDRSAAIEAQHRREYAAHGNGHPADAHKLTDAQRGERRSTGDQR
jgi:hypothetical protein